MELLLHRILLDRLPKDLDIEVPVLISIVVMAEGELVRLQVKDSALVYEFDEVFVGDAARGEGLHVFGHVLDDGLLVLLV
jgi:hypothetical protein